MSIPGAISIQTTVQWGKNVAGKETVSLGGSTELVARKTLSMWKLLTMKLGLSSDYKKIHILSPGSKKTQSIYVRSDDFAQKVFAKSSGSVTDKTIKLKQMYHTGKGQVFTELNAALTESISSNHNKFFLTVVKDNETLEKSKLLLDNLVEYIEGSSAASNPEISKILNGINERRNKINNARTKIKAHSKLANQYDRRIKKLQKSGDYVLPLFKQAYNTASNKHSQSKETLNRLLQFEQKDLIKFEKLMKGSENQEMKALHKHFFPVQTKLRIVSKVACDVVVVKLFCDVSRV